MGIKKCIGIAIVIFLVITCKSKVPKLINKPIAEEVKTDFTIAFGSCNKTTVFNTLWDDVLNVKPDFWAWGGDIVYADTEDMQNLRNMYDTQNKVAAYVKLRNTTPIIGTWDDHDYGLSDGGVDFATKKESQQEFLNFMNVPVDSPR